jgi:hypothetical protein
MSKFGGQHYILSIDQRGTSRSEKDVIPDSAMDYISKYAIPLHHRFTTRKHEATPQGFLGWQKPADFLYVSPTSFLRCNKRDKLLIFAHGSPSDVAGHSARVLAALLATWGLKEIGLITFKACSVGKENFLEDFLKYAAQHGAAIGWAKGYMGAAQTTLVPTTGGMKPTEVINDLRPVMTQGAKVKRDKHGNVIEEIQVLEGRDRYKVVSGPKNPWGAQTFGDRYF